MEQPPVKLQTQLVTPTAARSRRVASVPSTTLLPISSVLIWIGLFTVAWDRFGTFQVGSFNVKVPTIMFALGLALTITDRSFIGRIRGKRQQIVVLLFLTVAFYTAIGFAATNVLYAQLQTVTVIIGAVIPFLAVYLNIRLFGSLDQALTAFIRGGWFAAIFGLYQLAAFYTGLPQVVSYEARGGGLGRISSFTYESGYFGYFMILVLAALFARATLRQELVSVPHVVFFLLVLALANTRAAYLTIPLLFLLLFWRWPEKRTRPKLVGWAFVLGIAALIFALLSPSVVAVIAQRAASLFDPTETTSNAPRLAANLSSINIIGDNFWTGIGAGNLIDVAPSYGRAVYAGATSNSFIANNVYLQAMLDGGILLLLLQLLIVFIAVRTFYRRHYPASRALMAGWLAAFIVASFITSYFWDMKLWVILAIAAAAHSIAPQDLQGGTTRKTTVVSPR